MPITTGSTNNRRIQPRSTCFHLRVQIAPADFAHYVVSVFPSPSVPPFQLSPSFFEQHIPQPYGHEMPTHTTPYTPIDMRSDPSHRESQTPPTKALEEADAQLLPSLPLHGLQVPVSPSSSAAAASSYSEVSWQFRVKISPPPPPSPLPNLLNAALKEVLH